MKNIDKDIFYRSLFENNPEIALYLNSESVIENANQNLSKLLGNSFEDVLVTPLTNFLPQSEVDNFQRKFLEVLNGEPRSIKSFFIRNNGESIPIHIILIPVIVENV